jgi:hypothetical protein
VGKRGKGVKAQSDKMKKKGSEGARVRRFKLYNAGESI